MWHGHVEEQFEDAHDYKSHRKSGQAIQMRGAELWCKLYQVLAHEAPHEDVPQGKWQGYQKDQELEIDSLL